MTQRPDLQRLLDDVVEAGAPGVVAVVRNGSRTWRAATGKAVLKPARPMRPRDRLRVASIGKTFVATVVLQLVDEGRLGLDDTVEQRLPGLLREGRRITVRQLLNHTSGLWNANDTEEAGELHQRRIVAGDIRFDIYVRKAIALVDAQPLHFAPGTGWSYSNTGYEVLMLIVERVTGERLAQSLESRIIRPLRLTATSFEPQPLKPERGLAHGYAIPGGWFPQAFYRPFDVTAASNFPARWASGSLVSNADDVATFYSALLGGKLLPPELLSEMLDPVPTNDPRERYAFGISREGRMKCGWAWGHGGDAAGVFASKDGEGFQNVGSCCSAVVFVDQSAESVTAHDLSAARRRTGGCRVGREQRESPVRALAVVMGRIDA
jgi:D-alanyl-D-alanine carboxypeptidase